VNRGRSNPFFTSRNLETVCDPMLDWSVLKVAPK
jgi:hypothetical protein